MSEPPRILLEHRLKTLKLPTFLREYERGAPVGARGSTLCSAEKSVARWCSIGVTQVVTKEHVANPMPDKIYYLSRD